MSAENVELTGPDLERGIPFEQVPDGGMLGGHFRGKAVLIARHGDEIFAVGATCTHYGGPLAEGLLVDGTVRCPWHHACFDLRSGEPVRAPALAPLPRWAVERRNGMIFVRELPTAKDSVDARRVAGRVLEGTAPPTSIVIVGAGAAGDAAADMLRREGYRGPITLIGSDDSAPYDRPNLSKDYLAGTASEEWIPLRPVEFYEEHDIRLVTGRRVTSIDLTGRRVLVDDGTSHAFGALLLATGATPNRLPKQMDDAGRVRYLRTLADSRAIIAAAKNARTALILGASFIGLEVAASLRARGLEVHVVAPDERPLEKILGGELGDFVRGLHESRGITFHLGHSANAIGDGVVTLDDGTKLAAELVVAGIGVRPNDELASVAGIPVDRGIIVDARLQTNVPGIFAAGDVARYPDHRTGQPIRVEHWVVAQRMGQTAARNMLGAREQFDAAPFFWSQHYDVQISYVGHAERWDSVSIDGSLTERDCAISFREGGRTLAVATIGRDRASLEAEVHMESL